MDGSEQLEGEYSVEFEEQQHEAAAADTSGAPAITDAELDEFLEEDEEPAAAGARAAPSQQQHAAVPAAAVSQQALSCSGGSGHGAASAESSLVIEHDEDEPAAPAARAAAAAAAVVAAVEHEPLSSSSSSSMHEVAAAYVQEAPSFLLPVAAAAAVTPPEAAPAVQPQPPPQQQPQPPPQQQQQQQQQQQLQEQQQAPTPVAAAALAAVRPSTAAPAAVRVRPVSASAAATGRSSGHAAGALLQRPVSPCPAGSRGSMQQQQRWSPPRSAAGGSSSGSSTRGFFDEGPCQQQQQQCVLPVKQWGVPDVCDWLDVVGLGQYRKKFLHHCVNGHLLLQLTDELLKAELGIGPLGHRVLLLEAVQALQAVDLTSAAAAAAAGVAPDDFAGQLPGAALSAAAAGAVLAASLIGARAASALRCGSISGGGGGSGSPKPQLLQAGSPSSSGSWAGSPESRSGGGGSAGRRPCSAPTRWGRDANSPQAQSCPGSASLGPAAGRITVHEQRAKLLFELDRAQARAASQAGAAAQVSDVARLAAEEVARLQGQLADLDRKHKLEVQYGSGSLDGQGRIPWQHVGPGTRTADPYPERHARPWEPAELDFTYAPRISRTSAAIMAEARGEGGGGFLDRLDSDLRRRQSKVKELERRYYSSSGSGGAAKAATADLAVVSAYLSQRGWAHLAGSTEDAAAAQQMEEQLNEVVESYGKDLGLGAGQQQAVLAATLPHKLAALAAAVRTQQFMDRYHADLASRDGQLRKLQDKWFAQERSHGPGAVTPEQRDMASAAAWFGDLGWDVASDDCDELLGALLKRAQAYKAEAERLYCIQRERQAAGADRRASSTGGSSGASAAANVTPTINWAAVPWSLDGLDKKMQAVLQAQAEKAADAAAKAAAAKKPSAVDHTLRAAAGAPSATGGGSAQAASEARQKPSRLEHSVKLLAGLTVADLEHLAAASGKAKQLAVYRALRTQQFLDFTAADLASRHAKQQAVWEAFEASRRGKLVSKAELDEFYSRLQADGERRKADLAKAKADKIDREAKALALLNVANNAHHNRRSRPSSAARASK